MVCGGPGRRLEWDSRVSGESREGNPDRPPLPRSKRHTTTWLIGVQTGNVLPSTARRRFRRRDSSTIGANYGSGARGGERPIRDFNPRVYPSSEPLISPDGGTPRCFT